MSEHDDSAEVERLAEMLARTPAAVAPTQIEMAHIVLADLRKRYVLVPREGAEEWTETCWFDSDDGPIEKQRRMVEGPWEVAE